MLIMKNYNLIIFGNGAAAFAAAIKATELTEGKASILMVGNGPIGGTCVNVGCVPSKYLLELSNRYFYPLNSKVPGIVFKHANLDFSKVMESVRRLVNTLREEKYNLTIEKYDNVEVIDGKAYFTSPSTVMVESNNGNSNNGKFEARADYFLIATGSRPSIPPIDGLNSSIGYLTSDTVWQLNKLPSDLIVIGGGAIGLEIGQALRHFGSDVKIVEALPRIAYQAEPELSRALQHMLEQEGIRFYLRSRVSKISKDDSKVKVEVIGKEGLKVIEGDSLLIATGRKPNTDSLGLERAAIELDAKGAVKVNASMMTSNPKVYAAGDVVSKSLMLETLAAREGAIAAMNMFSNGKAKFTIDYLEVPWAIFTYPNLAGVGMSEEEAMSKYGACSCRVVELKQVPKARILMHDEGLAKMVISPEDGRILGMQVLAPYAAEFITEMAIAIKYKMRYDELIDIVHVFPTISEVLKINAQAFIRDLSVMSCCVE
jgi:mercuric reductase